MSSINNSKCALNECDVMMSTMSTRLCSGCQLVNYCSEGHQRSDWRSHQNICSPLTLQTSREFGRHFVASRDLRAGSLLLAEEPLLVEPLIISLTKQHTQFDVEQIIMGMNKQVCLSCCRPAGAGMKCPRCDWPICSIECSNAKIHAENECPLFVKNSLKMDKLDTEIMRGVFIIRLMMFKKSQPELWAQIQDMQSEGSNRTSAQRNEDIILGSFAKKVFLEKFHKIVVHDFGGEFFQDVELFKFFGVQMVNAFTRTVSRSEDTSVRNLYLKSSKSHACFPNCFWSISDSPEFKIEIRTSVDILAGVVLSITYSQVDIMIGPMDPYLNEMGRGGKGLNCFCPRCLDPTELQSMMSAVKCKIWNCSDYLIPKEMKNFSTSSLWECVQCGDTSHDTWKGIKHLTQRAMKMTSKFHIFEPKNIQDLLIILRKHLYPNHWVIQQFCLKVINELEGKLFVDSLPPNADGDVLDYYIEILKYLLQVFEVTMPGLNYFKSGFQLGLFKALDVKFRRMVERNKKMELGKEMIELLEGILKIKKFEPEYRNNDGQWSPTMLELVALKESLELFLK